MHEVRCIFPEPDVTDADVEARLATPWKRFGATAGLYWRDHQILRAGFQNAHQISDEMWRSNQPSPAQLETWAQKGIKTVINLRGVSPKGFHVLERDACARLGMNLMTFRVNSRDAPMPQIPRMARQMFDDIAYPALMHCKSGADRVGLMATYYKALRLGEPVSTAKEQLSGKYLHISSGKTGILDAYFDHYIETGEAKGVDLVTWSETIYDRDTFKASFKPGALGNVLVEVILRRE